MARLADETTVITGGTAGLGLALAREFLAEGARVVCGSRTPGDVRLLMDEYPGRVRYQQTDVTNEESVRLLMQVAVDAFDRLDVVVANAGVSRDGKVERLSTQDWRSMVDTNLTGVFLCTRAAVPHLRERGGAIVNVSSSMATRAAVGAAGYCATKAAVEMFTRVTAIELGRYGVRVNALAPGILDAGMGSRLATDSDLWSVYRKRFALGRPGAVAEVARAAVFLASADASYINGGVLDVNGGLLWA